jgi:CheY-like chemotaxis protein
VLDPSIPFVMMTQDRRVVEQTLTRILDTALKLTEKGKAPLRLSIGGGQDPVRIAITIYEAALAVRLANWLNINPDGALFQERDDLPFGIALMVAGKHLRALGGAIDLARDKKGHYTITLDLPSLDEAVDRDYRAGSEALNILVAEDCDESFVLTQGVLQDERVSRARDGSEALRMIQKQRFDVVFMDIHMPGMNGYEAIRSMRDWETQTGNARTPMVVLSSDDLETQERSAAEFGCSGFLLKPLRRLDLAPLLERLK